MPGRTVKFAAIWFPFIAMTVYILGGFLVCLDMPWDLSSLPTTQISQASHTISPSKRDSTTTGNQSESCSTAKTSSAFVLATLADDNIKEALRDVPMIRRWNRDPATDDYPYRSHGQPLMAWSALPGCLAILIVANGAPLWKIFTTGYFFGAYLAPICFLALWATLKILRRRPRGRWTVQEFQNMWTLLDLTDGAVVRKKIEALHERRARSAEEESDSRPGGLIGFLWTLTPSRRANEQQ
ncbi:MAG: hypothetical protein Q9165_000854 [Trypethelium subeluteriae]